MRRYSREESGHKADIRRLERGSKLLRTRTEPRNREESGELELLIGCFRSGSGCDNLPARTAERARAALPQTLRAQHECGRQEPQMGADLLQQNRNQNLGGSAC